MRYGLGMGDHLSAANPKSDESLIWFGKQLLESKYYRKAVQVFQFVYQRSFSRAAWISLIRIKYSEEPTARVDTNLFLSFLSRSMVYGVIVSAYESEDKIPDSSRAHDSWDKDYNSL